MKLLRMSEACEYMNLSESTLRRLCQEGKITSIRTEGGHRRFNTEELDRYIGIRPEKTGRRINVGYCRVSSSGQKDDLERQASVITVFCEKQGNPFTILKETGSGLNYKREKFLSLVEAVCNDQVACIVVNYKDRLMRFGYELFEKVCMMHGTEIVIMNQSEKTDNEKEMVEDILSIITVFSAKLYGQRSHRNKKIIEENRRMFSKEIQDEDCAKDCTGLQRETE